jgi:hypothetical protein
MLTPAPDALTIVIRDAVLRAEENAITVNHELEAAGFEIERQPEGSNLDR